MAGGKQFTYSTRKEYELAISKLLVEMRRSKGKAMTKATARYENLMEEYLKFCSARGLDDGEQ